MPKPSRASVTASVAAIFVGSKERQIELELMQELHAMRHELHGLREEVRQIKERP